MIRVVCWLWGDPDYRWNKHFIYGAEHVNRLRAMVARHLKIEHEFCCITDQPDGLDGDIRVIPIWDDLRELGGCYVRLKAFAPEMAEIIGPRFVSLDLDAVILGDITPLLTRKEEFIGFADPTPTTHYCGSMFMMDAGARAEVWHRFTVTEALKAKAETGAIGTDQAWISYVLGANEARWTRFHGVYTFRQIRKRANPPGNARIVFFTGPSDPSQKELQAKYPWIAEHWR